MLGRRNQREILQIHQSMNGNSPIIVLDHDTNSTGITIIYI